MSHDFDSIDDVVVSSAGVTLGNAISIAAWIDADNSGEGNYGIICTQGAGGAGRFALTFDGTNNGSIAFSAEFNSPTASLWSGMSPGYTTNLPGWKCVILTYTHAISQYPTLYTYVPLWQSFSKLTHGAGLTVYSAPGSGVPNADGGVVRIGNNDVLSRTFNGRIAEVAIWTRILTEAEAQAIVRLGALVAPDYMPVYAPLSANAPGQNLGYYGVAFSVSGAGGYDYTSDPPVRPGGRMG